MEDAKDRKSPNVHFVSAEEAATWEKRMFIVTKSTEKNDATIDKIRDGKVSFLELFEINTRFDLIYKEGEDRGTLNKVEENDIVVVKDGQREIRRLRYLGVTGTPEGPYLEFRALGPEGLR